MNERTNDAKLWMRWTLGTAFGPVVGLALLFGCLARDSYTWTITVPMSIVLIGILLGIGQWVILWPRWRSAWEWIPLTALGFLLGTYLGIILSNAFSAGDWNPILPGSIGAVLGVLQWPVLFRHVRRSIWWIPCSMISWTIGMGIPLVIFDHVTSPKVWANHLLAYGTGLGLIWGILVGTISGSCLTILIRGDGMEVKS